MTDQETNVSNGAESTLSASLSDSATTVNVTDTSSFSAASFYAVIDPADDSSREVVLVTAKTSTTFTVTRAQDGTSGVAHDEGAVVAQVPVAALWTDINDRVDAVDAAKSDTGHGHTESDISDLDHDAAIDARVDKAFVDALAVDHGALSGLSDFTTDHGTDHDTHDHSTALGTASLADLGTANLSDADDLGTFLANVEVDNSTEVASYTLTTSYANAAAVTLDIPAGWGSWKCVASATYVFSGVGNGQVHDAQLVIDGTAQQAQDDIMSDSTKSPSHGAIAGRRTGMTTTGSRTVSLQLREGSGDDVSASDIFLYARAVRTS